MKAAVLEAPNKLVVKEVHDPQIGPYDVLCELLYGAICTGTDTHIIKGGFPFSSPPPTILGHESIGRVVKAGEKVRHFRVGDLVTRVGAPASARGEYTSSWGGFATLGVATDCWAKVADGLERPPGKPTVQFPLPAGIDPAEATMIITWRETFSYVKRMGVAAGTKVLIIGSGGNGLAMANHAANLGASCVAMIGSPSRQQTAETIGVKHFADYHDGESAKQLKKTVGGGFDFCIDSLGRRGNLDLALSLLVSGGCVSMYGLDEIGQCSIKPGWSPFRYFPASYAEGEAHEAVLGFMRSGMLAARHWLDTEHPYPLEAINDAFADLAARRIGPKALVRLAE